MGKAATSQGLTMPIAILTILLLFIAAGALVVAGVYLLTALPWALIAAGILIFAGAFSLRMGLKTNA